MFKHSILALIVISTLAFQCGQSNKAESKLSMSTLEGQVLPFSDPSNEGGWVLNEELSDEFEGNSIDTSKWFVEGQNGDYYIWKGRAPSQFVPHNVIVEEGKLKLRTQWEPDYAFASESYADGSHDDTYGFHEGHQCQ